MDSRIFVLPCALLPNNILVEESKSFFAGLEIIKAEYDMTNYNNLATYNALFNISNKYS